MSTRPAQPSPGPLTKPPVAVTLSVPQGLGGCRALLSAQEVAPIGGAKPGEDAEAFGSV